MKMLHGKIVEAVVSIEELGLKDEKDMTVLFVPDMMQYGLGSEIIIEVMLFEKPERTQQILQKLAKNVGRCAKASLPSAKVECFVTTFNPKIQGYWDAN